MIRSGGQYDTSASLETRIGLHDRFSRNPQGWFPWLRELLHPHLAGRVLDVGCGTGVFWSDGAVHSRCSEITLADSSSAMIDVVRTRLSHNPRFRFEVCDARTLPFADASFEVLTAFHMLYDVPDMDAALSEFARATSPGGVVAISTNGVGHLRELDALLNRFVPGASWGDVPTRFTLENAESVLAGVFPQVLIHRYEDEL